MQNISKYRKFEIKQAKELSRIRKRYQSQPFRKSKITQLALKELKEMFKESYKRSLSVKQIVEEQLTLKQQLLSPSQIALYPKQTSFAYRPKQSLTQRTENIISKSVNTSIEKSRQKNEEIKQRVKIQKQAQVIDYPKLFKNRKIPSFSTFTSISSSPIQHGESYFFRSNIQKLIPVQKHAYEVHPLDSERGMRYIKPKIQAALILGEQKQINLINQKEIPYNEDRQAKTIRNINLLRQNSQKSEFYQKSKLQLIESKYNNELQDYLKDRNSILSQRNQLKIQIRKVRANISEIQKKELDKQFAQFKFIMFKGFFIRLIISVCSSQYILVVNFSSLTRSFLSKF